MSKTDKQLPVRVQMANGDRTFYAHHTGECIRGEMPCTLPDKPSPKHETNRDYNVKLVLRRPGRYWVYKVMCDWWPDPCIGKHGRIKSDCGCKQCTMQGYRKRQNSRNRRRAKDQIREELRETSPGWWV